MKRHYKLLKDLPTFNAGDIFELDDDGCLYWLAELQKGPDSERRKHGEHRVMAYYYKTLEQFPNILGEWFEEYKKPGEYWYIDAFGDVDFGTLCFHELTDPRAKIGNYFETKEEARKAIEWLKARKILLDDTAGFQPEPGVDHYHLSYNRKYGLGVVWRASIDGGSLISFPTREAAEASLKKHEKEWRVYLGLEEDE